MPPKALKRRACPAPLTCGLPGESLGRRLTAAASEEGCPRLCSRDPQRPRGQCARPQPSHPCHVASTCLLALPAPTRRLLSAFGPGSCREHAPLLGLSRPCRVQRNAFGCGDQPPRDGCFCKETMFFTKGESSSWECGEASALTDPRTGVSISGTTLASPHGRDMAAAAPTVTCSPGGQESVRTSSHSELAKKTLGRGVAAFPTTANPKPVCPASAAAGRVRPPPRRRRGAAGTQGRLHGQRS